jgi:hypothetical protein
LQEAVKAGRAADQDNSWEQEVLRQAGKNNPKSYDMESSHEIGFSGCDDGAAYSIPMGGIYGESSEGSSLEWDYEPHNNGNSNSISEV